MSPSSSLGRKLSWLLLSSCPEFQQHTRCGPVLHEHTDHGLLRRREAQACPACPRSTSQQRTPVCSAFRHRPLNFSWEAFPDNDEHARLGPRNSRASAITNLLQPGENANSVNPTSSGGEGEWRSLPHPRVATFCSPRRLGLCLWDILRTVAKRRNPVEIVFANFGCQQEQWKRADCQAKSLSLWLSASNFQSGMKSVSFWTASTQFVQHLGLVSSIVSSVITLWINLRPAATDSELCPPRGCETTRPTRLALSVAPIVMPLIGAPTPCRPLVNFKQQWDQSRVCATSWSPPSRRC